MDDDTVKPCFM